MDLPRDSGDPAVIQVQPFTQLHPNVPAGLDFLTTIDKMFIEQKVELMEAFVGLETNNKYTMKSESGNPVFHAFEDVDCCIRNCCGKGRPFDMKIFDMNQVEVMHFHRPLRCDSCLCPCFLQRLEVSSPPGTIVGSIEQDWSLCAPSFSIMNESGDKVMSITGPCITCSLCGTVEFKVMSTDGDVQVGRISKQWSGLVKEYFTDMDTFGISFPIDLDVRMKAVMLGACLLIDYMYFEANTEGPVANCRTCMQLFTGCMKLAQALGG